MRRRERWGSLRIRLWGPPDTPRGGPADFAAYQHTGAAGTWPEAGGHGCRGPRVLRPGPRAQPAPRATSLSRLPASGPAGARPPLRGPSPPPPGTYPHPPPYPHPVPIHTPTRPRPVPISTPLPKPRASPHPHPAPIPHPAPHPTPTPRLSRASPHPAPIPHPALFFPAPCPTPTVVLVARPCGRHWLGLVRSGTWEGQVVALGRFVRACARRRGTRQLAIWTESNSATIPAPRRLLEEARVLG